MLKSGWILLAILLLTIPGAAQEKSAPLDMKVVKYDGLKETILKNRGKVVIVEVWQITCIPCLRNIAHFVEMQKKDFAKEVVVVTVNVDAVDPENPEMNTPAKVLTKTREKLEKQGVGGPGFINLQLDEKSDFWTKQLRLEFLPGVYVFDRQGRWTQFKAEGGKTHGPAEVEELAQKLVQEK